jgi:hypothetical protein
MIAPSARLSKLENGRGFTCKRHIVTAASCLPRFPAFKPFDSERSFEFKALLGWLGEAPSLPALCVFADVVSNVAILRDLEDDLASNWNDWFSISAPHKSSIAGAPTQQAAWVLSLEGDWVKCVADIFLSGIRIRDLPFELDGRLSGSPIDEGGAAFGIICAPLKNPDHENWMLHPVAASCLPAWMGG